MDPITEHNVHEKEWIISRFMGQDAGPRPYCPFERTRCYDCGIKFHSPSTGHSFGICIGCFGDLKDTYSPIISSLE